MISSVSPFLVTTTVFCFFVNTALSLFLGKMTFFIAAISVVLFIFCIVFWFCENFYAKLARGDNILDFSFILFIITELLFFITLFFVGASFVLQVQVASGINLALKNALFLRAGTYVLVGTATLLYASFLLETILTVFRSRGFVLAAGVMCLVTAAGLLFLIFQITEYNESAFSLASGVAGSIFFFATGFHGVHVLVAVLGAVFFLIVFSTLSQKRGLVALELVSWYWHFVDLVWLFVLYFFYYLPIYVIAC